MRARVVFRSEYAAVLPSIRRGIRSDTAEPGAKASPLRSFEPLLRFAGDGWIDLRKKRTRVRLSSAWNNDSARSARSVAAALDRACPQLEAPRCTACARRLRPEDWRRPGEAGAAELRDQHICRETRPAAITIWKRMHRDQAVMESDRDFVGRKRFVLDPITRIVDRLPHGGLDLKRLDAEIALCGAVLSGPSPNAVEHAAMQAFEKPVPGDDVLAAERPAIQYFAVRLR